MLVHDYPAQATLNNIFREQLRMSAHLEAIAQVVSHLEFVQTLTDHSALVVLSEDPVRETPETR